MSGSDAGVAILLLIVFITGVSAGIVVIVAVASRREDRLGSLTGAAPDRACQGARRLVGAGFRGHYAPAVLSPDQDGNGGPRGQEPDR